MLVRTLAFPLLTSDYVMRSRFRASNLTVAAPSVGSLNVNPNSFPSNVTRGSRGSLFSPKKWERGSTEQIPDITLRDEDRKEWEACRESLSAFDFSVEEKDEILAKAFGHVHSPYWSEERKQEVPKFGIACEILDYLRSLGLSNDDLYKLLKKFPEVLGCNLEEELRNNVKMLDRDWGINGKSLRNLLLRNPKVLGYNVDCKGDCMAKCTRCWVRF
uniref:Uncharacterized protein LOC105135118 n=1 Tax=Rhizophora mucronata TaxID=61149 RepID=A0A2P2J636_RHIMU